MRLLTAISFTFAAVVGACSVANPNHCANLEGHATCAARGELFPYCSKCVADNDGCVAEPLDDACDAGESSAPGSTTTPTTGDPPPSSTSSASSSSTSGTTTTGSSEGQTGTTDTSEATSESTSTTTAESTSSTTAGSTDDTAAPEPMCGDDIQELPEICDGADLGQYDSCTAKNPTRYGGGQLKCVADCSAYDEAACCLAPGQNCLLNGQACCAGASCQLLGMDLNLFTCKPT